MLLGSVKTHLTTLNVIDDMKVDINTLARFKRHLQEEDSVENRNEVERYLVDGYEDPNDD
jgi:hypothetical protein